jgi:hypothetical protein
VPWGILEISWKQIFTATNIDAISAKDRTTKLKPKKFQMYAQNNPANPPSTNPCVFALRGVSNMAGIRGSFHLRQLTSRGIPTQPSKQ